MNDMKILKIVCIFLLVVGVASSAFTEEVKRSAKVVDYEGQVEARLMGERKWAPAESEMVLTEGDILRTRRDSWALLNLDGDGETATVTVQENSQLLISKLTRDEAEGSQETLLDLGLGKVLIEAEKLHSEKSKFEVKTPTSVVGVRGTTFAVEVEALE